ncbi:unnamed protein product, partial [Vitis vinifera]|uniref:Uncharacterized protein n=1 Tax=Vitis vinifera TaxID=29760 RepID=D7SRN0_VITVI
MQIYNLSTDSVLCKNISSLECEASHSFEKTVIVTFLLSFSILAFPLRVNMGTAFSTQSRSQTRLYNSGSAGRQL